MDDAFGRALLDHLDRGGNAGLHVIERDDGYVEEASAAVYFGGPESWAEAEAVAAEAAGETILDVGAGAGRHSLAFQSRGNRVTALDPSPGAAEVCRRRGVRAVVEGVLSDVDGAFDTFAFFGNNLALLAAEPESFFPHIDRLGTGDTVIIGSTIDPYRTEDPVHVRYHERNRRLGRPAGRVTLRIRHRDLASAWFDLLFTTREELGAIVAPHGWRIVEIVDRGGTIYALVLRR